MYISNIKLKNFRNYEEEKIELNKGINIFFGENAQGKTNILESIFLCSLGKSYRVKKEKEIINFEKKDAKVEIEYLKKDRSGKIKVEIEENKKIYLNDIKLKKASEILGNINIVMFTPDDINILKDGPSSRRKFLNMMISQLRPIYVHNLNLYLKTIEQRNNYLKQIKNNVNNEMLDIWDEKLVEYSEKIFLYRNEFIEKIKEKIDIIHKNLTNNKEEIKINYLSDFTNKKEYLLKLKENRKEDIKKGFTTKGIHRDDILFFINKKQVSTYCSQGQHRTAILSLKISELEIINDEIGEKPILLLDDFMSELDKKRQKNLLENIENMQIIITCTDDFNIENKNCNRYKVINGKIEKT